MVLKVALLLVVLSPYILAQSDITKRQKALYTCLTESPKPNSNTFIKGNACIRKCVSEKLGLVDSSGNPIETNYDVHERRFVQDCNRDSKQDDPCLRVDAFEICLEGKREEHQDLMKKQCREESKYEDHSNEDISNAACYHKCLAVKNGVLSDDGDIVIEAIRNLTGDDLNFEDYVEKCQRENQNLIGCENTMFVLQCVIENSKMREFV